MKNKRRMNFLIDEEIYKRLKEIRKDKRYKMKLSYFYAEIFEIGLKEIEKNG